MIRSSRATALVQEKQLIILFHINDLKLAHKLPMIVTKHIKLLDIVNSDNDPLTITRGKIHEYIRVTIDFSLKIV